MLRNESMTGKRAGFLLIALILLLALSACGSTPSPVPTPTRLALLTATPTEVPTNGQTPVCDNCITITGVRIQPGWFTLVGESALPDGTCLQTQLYVEDEPLPWWPKETCVTVQDGMWQISVSLEESGAPYERPLEGGYTLVAWQKDRRIASAVFWIEYSGPPTPPPTASVAQPTATAMPSRTPTTVPSTPTREPTPVVPKASAPFTHTLQTYRGSGFSFQHPAGARLEVVTPTRMAWQRTSPATTEIHVTGPQVWVQPGDADWSYRGPAYELTLRTYENPEGLEAESWARAYLLDAWQEARELSRPWGALPVTEEGEIDEGKVAAVTVAGQPAFWVSYFSFDSTQPAYYVRAGQHIVELSFRLYPVANQPLAMVQRDVYALILSTLRLESEAVARTERVLPSGLVIEAYALQGPPQVEPLTFEPVERTAQEILQERQAERERRVKGAERVWKASGPEMSVMLGANQLVASEMYTDTAEGQVGAVQVTYGGRAIYTVPLGPPSPVDKLRGLWAHDDHWYLEVADWQGQGQMIRDGASLNERYGYEDAFGFQLLNGKPFYFYRRDGQIGVSFDGQETLLGYDDVPHNQCCSAAEANPVQAEKMVAFFALRGETWHYVEIGSYE
jgi:hypothetical protein